MSKTLPSESGITTSCGQFNDKTVDVRVLAAVDKFKGTATGAEVARAIGHACWELGIECDEVALADGGEGTLDALGGPNRSNIVTGPLGDLVEAHWRFHRGTAVIEMAQASGLVLVGGPESNDAVAASTTGTGELIDRALDMGAERILVCLGGSATTDGGLGAVRAIHAPARLRAIEFVVACDVDTLFVDAARVFAPQKGATSSQVRMLEGRLERLVQMYKEEYGVDVSRVPGSGAAGGLAGGLVALGGRLIPGFDMVADEVDLADRIRAADLVITGEGQLDITSFEGKVVGGVAQLCAELGTPVAAIVGRIDASAKESDDYGLLNRGVYDLESRFGAERSFTEPRMCIEEVARGLLTTTVG
ncbi:MAG: glycerate kinase [Ilumatobacteraceae bacterium]